MSWLRSTYISSCARMAGHKVIMVDKGFMFPLTLTAVEQMLAALAGGYQQHVRSFRGGNLRALLAESIQFCYRSETLLSYVPSEFWFLTCSAGIVLAQFSVLGLRTHPAPRNFLFCVLPCAFSSAGALWLGNWSYLRLSVTYIQMRKVVACHRSRHATPASHMHTHHVLCLQIS